MENENNNQKRKNLLLCCSGSVASVLTRELIEYGIKENYNIKCVLTNSAQVFAVKDNTLDYLKAYFKDNNFSVEILTDEDEWNDWKFNKKVLHIDLRNWADCLLLAPVSANTLSKIYNGISDNLLTCIVKAWDFKKPIVYALAMNTLMYNNKITQMNKEYLNKELGFIEVQVISKILKCGEMGKGAMANISTIFNIVKAELNKKKITDYFKIVSVK